MVLNISVVGWVVNRPRWKTIDEDTPRDGTELLLLADNGDIFVGSYIDHEWSPYGCCKCTCAFWPDGCTHWMSLPDKPEEK